MQLFNQPESRLDEVAINDLSKERTWRQLQSNVVFLAEKLVNEFGLKPNDHIALHIGNRVEFIEGMLAGIVAGLWVTPINTHLTKSEAEYILSNSEAKLLLNDGAQSLAGSSSATQNLNLPEQLGKSNASFSHQCNSLFDENSPAGGTMLYTSGTTGKPKGVMRYKPDTLGEALQRMKDGGKAFGLNGKGPHLVTGPLYHAAPMLFALYDLLNGAPLLIMPKWETVLFLELVTKYQVVTTHLVPTMMVRLIKHRNQYPDTPAPAHLELVLHGAAPIAKTTKTDMLDWWGDILIEYWGGSEAGVTTLVNSTDWRNHPGTVGKPLSHFTVYVGDEQGNPSQDSEGMLYCRHRDIAQVFQYFNDPEKTAKAHPKPHVFCIGDMGHVDSDGYVYLSDRASNMIISGGVNIYPAEIEQALINCDLVADCAVVGKPSEEWGEDVVAVVQLDQKAQSLDYNSAVKDLHNHLDEKIARYKLPKHYVFVRKLPRMPTGKVAIKSLKALLDEESHERIEKENCLCDR